MKKLSKLEKFMVIFLAIPTAIFIIYEVGLVSVRKKSLSDNMEYIHAVVDTIGSGIRGRKTIYYDFSVKEIQYRGSGEYYPSNISVSIGDSVLVVYDGINPKNNELLWNYNADKKILSYAIPISLLIGLYYFWKWQRKKKKQEEANEVFYIKE